jgi:His-Xaa-Ser system protein HxsD
MPADQFEVEIATRSVSLTLDESLYPLDAIYGATYTFIDRCYVLLDRAAPSRVRVVLTPKKEIASAEELRNLAGELVNELLSCAWRAQIVRENRAVIEAVTMQAVGGALGPPSLDELKDFDFSEEPFEDPLGIGQSWEDKYKKKKDGAPAEAAPAAEAAAPREPGSGT